jgi:hypothetical protein
LPGAGLADAYGSDRFGRTLPELDSAEWLAFAGSATVFGEGSSILRDLYSSSEV